MNKEFKLWQFIAERLRRDENVMLLVVATSSGSSPGRQGYKMAIGSDGELFGSIGGGVMEVSLVEQAKSILSAPRVVADGLTPLVKDQVHRKDVPNSSGMICSGKQTVIFTLLGPKNADTVDSIVHAMQDRRPEILSITPDKLNVYTGSRSDPDLDDFCFEKNTNTDFVYKENLGFKNDLFIIGGGHCALALSELMSKMDFRISIFDDRPTLNTIDKNRFAHEIKIIDGYEQIGDKIDEGENVYVVVMTLGYKSDGVVIRQLIERDFRYFGVLGSKAKMATLLKELKGEGIPAGRLDSIHTPIGMPINSHTPEEIAVSIAAEIIAVKNKTQTRLKAN